MVSLCLPSKRETVSKVNKLNAFRTTLTYIKCDHSSLEIDSQLVLFLEMSIIMLQRPFLAQELWLRERFSIAGIYNWHLTEKVGLNFQYGVEPLKGIQRGGTTHWYSLFLNLKTLDFMHKMKSGIFRCSTFLG